VLQDRRWKYELPAAACVAHQHARLPEKGSGRSPTRPTRFGAVKACAFAYQYKRATLQNLFQDLLKQPSCAKNHI
jgi:hypothetical protein